MGARSLEITQEAARARAQAVAAAPVAPEAAVAGAGAPPVASPAHALQARLQAAFAKETAPPRWPLLARFALIVGASTVLWGGLASGAVLLLLR